MAVRAKFYVAEKTDYAGGNSSQVKLNAVTRGDHNKAWASATPSGQITMHISNPAAVLALKLGAEYLVTFEESAPEELADGHPFRQDDRGMAGCGDCGLASEAHDEPRRSELIRQSRGE